LKIRNVVAVSGDGSNEKRYGFDVARCAGATLKVKKNMYLNCHSYHSLRYGTIPLTELVQLAAMRCKSMALTDYTVTGIYVYQRMSGCRYKTHRQIEFRPIKCFT
jgi:hypothetical protein